MSRRTHSSNTSIMNRPYCSGPTERCVTRSPSCLYRGLPLTPSPQPESAMAKFSAVARSMIGMNWMKVGAELVAEERVDLATVIAVDRVDRGEHVPVDLVALQDVEASHHSVERRLAALVDTVGIVHLTRSVDRDPDQEPVLLEKLTPLVVQKRPVGLHRVEDVLARLARSAARARSIGGRSPVPSSSARRPARPRPPRGRARELP